MNFDFENIQPTPEQQARLDAALMEFQDAVKEYADDVMTKVEVSPSMGNTIGLQLTLGICAYIRSINKSHHFARTDAKEHFAGMVGGIVGGVLMPIATMPSSLKALFIHSVTMGLNDLAATVPDLDPGQGVH